MTRHPVNGHRLKGRSRTSISKLRLDDIQRRLDGRRASLTAQFIAMEAALSRAQALGAALTAQVNALQSTSR